jgi:6-phosphogluconolactonase
MMDDPGPAPGRRALIIGTLAASAAVAGAAPVAAEPASVGPAPRFAYVGCRTTKERNARGEGIGVYRVDHVTGAWLRVQLVQDLANPSFLAFDRTQRFLYAVHGDLSDITAFRINPDSGELTFLNRQSTEGRNPAHLTADESNRFMVVANYATGTLAVLPRNSDGSLRAVRQLEKLPGEPGPNRIEQGSSHPHEVAWDRARRFLIVPDKGLDRIFTFRFDGEVGALIAGNPAFVQVRPGAGPRHVAFHPVAPFAFVAQELDSSVGTFAYEPDNGELKPIQVLPSTPDTFTGANTAAEIEMHPSGRFLFVSNRGHDSIATFAIDAASGRLTPLDWTASQGKGPRFFALDPSGTRLYAANENSDTIVRFSVDPQTGRLSREGEVIQTGSPVWIVF